MVWTGGEDPPFPHSRLAAVLTELMGESERKTPVSCSCFTIMRQLIEVTRTIYRDAQNPPRLSESVTRPQAAPRGPAFSI